MKTRLLLTLLSALAAGAIGLSGTAVAQGQGGGGGNGGGGGGAAPPDYGDLIILHRNDFGVPELDANFCQQPIAFTENVGCPEEGLIPVDDVLVVPTDPVTCAIEMSFSTCTNEADFGRTNLSRSSDEVLASQLEDVVSNLAIADCTSLDPAGRMVHSRWDGDELLTSTIDSPLQNLAVYKQLMLTGDIGVPLPEDADPLTQAARGFGVAIDKSGEVGIDLLVYLNEILGLTEGSTYLGVPPICIDVKEEVMGSIEMVEKCFLNYGAYLYQRGDNFGSLPSPAYIPEADPDDPLIYPLEGTFEFLFPDGEGYIVTFGSILAYAFDGINPAQLSNVEAFALTADDTRAVINYMHNWPVPGEAETAVPCDADPNGDTTYDLAISEMSGLQVPKMMVPDTEGREFTVAVSNAGPDVASGFVRVTAVQAAGGPVLIEGEEGPFEFAFEDLQSGLSYSTTQHFTIGEPHVVTTINWTATVFSDHDINSTNDTATARTSVKTSTGGGGGRGGGGH
jgi:hypothetical protein